MKKTEQDKMLRDIFLAFVRVHLLHHASAERIYGLEMIEDLRRHGYERIIQTILDAPEFRSVNNLSDFGSLAGLNNNPSWRSERSRYAVRDN